MRCMSTKHSSPPPIILVAFGTSTAARATYSHFEDRCRRAFPDHDIRWAYSSSLIRHKMKVYEGDELKSLSSVMKELQAAGYDRAVIQSLHIIPGIAFNNLLDEVKISGLATTVGQPLLSGAEDVEKAIDAIFPWLPSPDETLTILIGHGTSHTAATRYAALDLALTKRGLRNVLVGTVTGEPSGASAIETAGDTGLKQVHFIPFMFVAGEHISTDIMGDGETSWKSRLSGLSCTVEERGLGYNEGIADIFLDHLRQAIERV